MATITVNLVKANGKRVRITLRNSTVLCAVYHVSQVFPGWQSAQVTVQREVASC